MNPEPDSFEARAHQAGAAARSASTGIEIPAAPEARGVARQPRRRRVFAWAAAAAVAAALTTLPYLGSDKGEVQPAGGPLATLGVPAAQAECLEVTTDRVSSPEHTPAGMRIGYPEVPPSSGRHWPTFVREPREFYTERTRPPVEELVHNLEHGYTILWYDSTISGDQQQVLLEIATQARLEPTVQGKFIVTAWDERYGSFPPGTHVALSHWSADAGHRQLCGDISGEVVKSFVARFPSSDAPEGGSIPGSPQPPVNALGAPSSR